MTLLINEIYILGDLQKGMILFAADQRITLNSHPPMHMKKIFKIPYLNAGVGYFGLAQINQTEYLSSWLPNFIRHATDCLTIQSFAERLHQELNQKVDKTLLAKYPSGFHVCGYNANHYPELWHIYNHGMEGNDYIDYVSTYYISEDFLSQHARKLGFDGINPKIPGTYKQYYINGDVRAFHLLWTRLDDFPLEMVSNYGDFKAPENPDDFVSIMKWKMEVISSYYQRFAAVPLIGKPINTFALLPSN